MTIGLVLLLASAVAILFWPRRIVEYASGASGKVIGEDGQPIAGAEVTIHFREVVFDAITPTNVTKMTTDENGKFGDHFISCGKPGGEYRVVVKKEGFHPSVVTGTGVGEHQIVLKTERVPS